MRQHLRRGETPVPIALVATLQPGPAKKYTVAENRCEAERIHVNRQDASRRKEMLIRTVCAGAKCKDEQTIRHNSSA